VCNNQIQAKSPKAFNKMCDIEINNVLADLTSQYVMRGSMIDAMAARSNQMLSKLPAYKGGAKNANGCQEAAEKATAFYDDWETDIPAEWPAGIKKRSGAPHAFHKRIGKWVTTHSHFGYVADLSEWVKTNQTNSVIDRESYYTKWSTMPRHLRMQVPYSYYPNKVSGTYTPGSIIIRNITPDMNESDLMMVFSTFGHIVDFHRPIHYTKKKKTFYAFVEYYNVESVDKLINCLGANNILYFMDYPIIIDRAGDRKTKEDMITGSN
jgi:hypothetical protein